MTNRERTRIHLDTDIGGDADDLCALAMLLGSPDVELVGITTCADFDGGRAAFIQHALKLAGRTGIPVASGARQFLGGMPHDIHNQDRRYWPNMEPVDSTPPGAAIDLLCENAASGATVVAIGPYTNLALAVAACGPSVFRGEIITMGGWTGLPAEGLPQMPASWDYNVQCDTVAARVVYDRLDPLVVPLGITLEAWLRAEELPALRGGGPLSNLVARQAELQGAEGGAARMIAENPGLPRDLLNFQYDPLACAAALGWDCLTVSPLRLAPREIDGCLQLDEREGAKVRRVVTAVDSPAFSVRWRECVSRV
jgi:inosine-uridine nucleoside N-ribohydrolase